ncbi:MAG: ATP-dependent Clp protease ATP-binding subunit [Candidatus Yanofskybacteria bacterium]|nr:ATP-dependent Clp protease ATP-binding subunit [Candidatus Yanofskybacteria bacterium]
MAEFSSTFRLPTSVELEVFLKDRLKGQPKAIEAVIKHYRVFRSGLKDLSEADREGPIGVFFFLGPSGTGKSLLGQLVAEAIYGTKNAAALFEMEGFRERHTVARFIGSPPGYIKCDQPAELSPQKLYERIPGMQSGQQQEERNEQGRRIIRVSAKDFLEIKEREQSLKMGEIASLLCELDMIDRTFLESQIELEEAERRLEDLETQKDILEEKKASTGAKEKEIKKIIEEIKGLNYWVGQLQLRKKTLLLSYLFTVPLRVNEWLLENKKTPIEQEQTEEAPKKIREKLKTENLQQDKEQPVLILIFDEFEKANEEIYNFFLNMIGKGRITLANGEVLDLRRAMIFFTSNAGSRQISELATGKQKQIGIIRQDGTKRDMEKIAREALKSKFDPEFLNRLDETVVFENLSDETMLEILDLQLEDFMFGLQKTYVKLVVKPEVKRFIVEQNKLRPEGQAHYLLSLIKNLIKVPVGEMLEKGQVKSGQTIIASMEKGKINFLTK